MNFATGLDQQLWRFEAPKEYFTREMAASYGGYIRITLRALYGNFTDQNYPLDMINIECETCNTGNGLRIVRFADGTLLWDGGERIVEIPLLPGKWMKDPLNSAEEFKPATECDIAATLMAISRVTVLGDYTRGGEGVAMDDIAFIAAHPALQPAFPWQCQAGCVCRHNKAIKRPKLLLSR